VRDEQRIAELTVQVIDLKEIVTQLLAGFDWPTEEKSTLELRKRAKAALKRRMVP
jgi:hypothetical protein